MEMSGPKFCKLAGDCGINNSETHLKFFFLFLVAIFFHKNGKLMCIVHIGIDY